MTLKYAFPCFEAEVDSMMKKNLDSVTGKVSFPQFLEIFDDQNTIGDVEKTPEDAFRLLSPDGEPITVQHLIKFFGQFPEDIAKEELEAVHRLCDEDKDGVWTLEGTFHRIIDTFTSKWNDVSI